MNIRGSLGGVMLALLVAATAIPLPAGEKSYAFRSVEAMDAAGRDLRRAVSAWQDANGGVSTNWMPVEISPASRVALGGGLTLLYVEALRVEGKSAARLLLLAGSEAPTRVVREGETATLGPVEVQVVTVSATSRGRTILLVRRAGEPPVLADNPGRRTWPKLTGDAESRRLTVVTNNDEELRFVDAFMARLMEGQPAKEASSTAFKLVPPLSPKPTQVEDAGWTPGGTGGEDSPGGSDGDWGGAVRVTLRSVVGDESAVRELSSSVGYNSEGRTGKPAVTASGGAGGTEVTVGGPADRFSGKIRALEAEGRLHVTNESNALIELGSDTRMAIEGGGRTFDVILGTQNAGRGVILDVDLIERNAGTAGQRRRQRIRVTDGSTVQLAGFTQTRNSTTTGQTPVLGGIPWLGSIFKGERRESENLSMALFATVERE